MGLLLSKHSKQAVNFVKFIISTADWPGRIRSDFDHKFRLFLRTIFECGGNLISLLHPGSAFDGNGLLKFKPPEERIMNAHLVGIHAYYLKGLMSNFLDNSGEPKQNNIEIGKKSPGYPCFLSPVFTFYA